MLNGHERSDLDFRCSQEQRRRIGVQQRLFTLEFVHIIANLRLFDRLFSKASLFFS